MGEEAMNSNEPAVISETHQMLQELSGYFAIVPDELVKAGNPSALAVYAILDRIGSEGKSQAAYATIGEATGLSINTIKKSLAWLAENNFIEVISKGSGHDSSRYHLPFQRQPKGRSTPGVSTVDTQGVNSSHRNRDTEKGYSALSVPSDSNESSVTTSAARITKKRVTQITDEFIAEMHERFDPELGEVRTSDQIKKAIGHIAYRKYDDKQAYLRIWLTNAVDFSAGKSRAATPSTPSNAEMAELVLSGEYDMNGNPIKEEALDGRSGRNSTANS
jgi:hypothetical protein